MIYKVKVGTLYVDNGDGSSSNYLFPSYEDAVAEKRIRMEDWGLKDFSDDDVIHEYGYECGELGTDVLEFEVLEDGTARLHSVHSIYSNNQ